jgi:hypothetical protein
MKRPLARWILERLARGPARPCEIRDEFGLNDQDCSRALRLLRDRGKIHATRLIVEGCHGGNVAVIYQLVR